MKVYNSISKKSEEFKPVEDELVLYVCGLTPYDKAHIGHARTYVAFDILKRYLMKKGWKITHIQNITDVDDKIIRRCMETGADPKKLTEENHREALELFDKLCILRADFYPKVTEHIPDIISTIQKILKNGYAYETKTGVYFDVSKFKGYGKLSGQNMEEIEAGSRKEVDETKNDPADFALWKTAKGEIIEFDSPWGKGRPGWHIECSAMSIRYAKRTIDIHGGARDLIFPHHENEIAQSEAANGFQFVKYWMHTGFLTVNGEKMSKSLGNFITIADVLNKHEPNAVRMFFALAHYRSPIDYNEEQIEAAGESAERLLNGLGLIRECISEKKVQKKNDGFRKNTDTLIEKMNSAMENDFDTPTAIANLFNLVRESNAHMNEKNKDYEQLGKIGAEIEKMLWILGISERKADASRKIDALKQILSELGEGKTPETAEKMMERAIELRNDARKKKDFTKSDSIRKKLGEIGIILEDKEGKTSWKME
jgi:cysteinyl-tRNA synthetase